MNSHLPVTQLINQSNASSERMSRERALAFLCEFESGELAASISRRYASEGG
jgi:hypothetical protein